MRAANTYKRLFGFDCGVSYSVLPNDSSMQNRNVAWSNTAESAKGTYVY